MDFPSNNEQYLCLKVILHFHHFHKKVLIWRILVLCMFTQKFTSPVLLKLSGEFEPLKCLCGAG